MTELSPAAQAVLDAFRTSHTGQGCLAAALHEAAGKGCHLCVKRDLIAAALRAVVDQVIPITESPWGSTLVPVLSAEESRKRLLAIADELEAQ